MLKSTHKSLVPSPVPPPTLPSGWTEHKAPSGHSYYYNTETKQSTYSRPPSASEAPITSPGVVSLPSKVDHGSLPGRAWNRHSTPATGGPYSSSPGFQSPDFSHHQADFTGRSDFRGGRSYQDRRHRQPEDRPRSKHVIPGCEPWLLVKTKLGRRFVYNPEANESFWKFPQHVLKGVIEYDRLEREKKEKKERGEDDIQEEPTLEVTKGKEGDVPSRPAEGVQPDEDSDEYEEVEVTDDDDENGNPPKRPRGSDSHEVDSSQPVEFDEDDIAYQLAGMGENFDFDDYGEGNGDENQMWEEGDEEPRLTEEDSTALFHDLLDDFGINPYRTWEQIIEDGRIIEDNRYTALPTMKARREAWDAWSRGKIQELREVREKEEKKDPKIRYVAFLQTNATPKLYWPEFKRKFRKEPELRDPNLSEKDREKMYRDHINRLKLPESTRKSDLSSLLKTAPLSTLNASSTPDSLPTAIITDLRYISLPPKIRDPLIEAYILTLAPAPDPATTSVQNLEDVERKKIDRERREKALADRERKVQEQKRKQMGAMKQGREILDREEAEIERAMRVDGGMERLKGYMDVDVQGHEEAP